MEKISHFDDRDVECHSKETARAQGHVQSRYIIYLKINIKIIYDLDLKKKFVLRAVDLFV